MTAKSPFRLATALKRIEKTVAPYPKAALFELADRGYGSVFAQLVACLISTRTRDEVTLPAALRLLEKAPSPEKVAKLNPEAIDAAIRPCTFHRTKARQIQAIAREVALRFGGDLPCDGPSLLSLRGIGPKCANLVLGVACKQPAIGVDIHVHRVTNRWGYIRTRTPEETTRALETRLPRQYWIEINRLLVPFGKHVCTGIRPKCSTCPVLSMCRQAGVTAHR